MGFMIMIMMTMMMMTMMMMMMMMMMIVIITTTNTTTTTTTTTTIIMIDFLSHRLVGTAIKRAVAVGAEEAGPPEEPDGSKIFVRVEGDKHEDAVFK